jgi:hypothetical protein
MTIEIRPVRMAASRAAVIADLLHTVAHVRPPRRVHLRGPLTPARLERRVARSAAVGRSLTDVIAAVAEPTCLLRRVDGSQVAHWQSTSGWGAVRAVSLLFDPAGICVGRLGAGCGASGTHPADTSSPADGAHAEWSGTSAGT